MPANEEKKVTLAEYIIGFCSFIPMIGVLLGAVSIVLGALKFKAGGWKVILLGVGGILFTIVLYSAIFFFAFSGKNNVMTDMQNQMSRGNLRQCVLALEFYKQVHGAYPDKLQDLLDPKHPTALGMVNFYDQTGGLMKNMAPQFFYYEKTADGTGYYLLGRGPDGKEFTGDDVLPDLSPEEMAHSGFRKK
jgi:hypothetical protein